MARKPDKEWDAGQIGCGELVLKLAQQLKHLQEGQVLKLRAYDPGAQADLPAWCKLTGHALLKSARPEYWIKKRTRG